MTVLVAVRRLSASAAVEVREACKALELEAIDWVRGVPRVPPRAVIGGLGHGERRIPEELVALLEASPAARLVLCAQELLVKPRVVIGDGRVCVLAPPIERAQVVAALRAAIELPPAPIDAGADRRFEVLRRSHWIAWTRGQAGPAISLHEQRGATVVIGAARDRLAIAEAMAAELSDADREAALGELAGTCGVAHLTHDANEWLLHWPAGHGALWICSPHRLPSRWDAARAIAGLGSRRVLRLRAFPEDQLVAAWSDAVIAGDVLAPIQRTVIEGGAETFAALDGVVRRESHATGLVIEVR